MQARVKVKGRRWLQLEGQAGGQVGRQACQAPPPAWGRLPLLSPAISRIQKHPPAAALGGWGTGSRHMPLALFLPHRLHPPGCCPPFPIPAPGLSRVGPAAEQPLSEFEEVMAANYFGVVRVTQVRAVDAMGGGRGGERVKRIGGGNMWGHCLLVAAPQLIQLPASLPHCPHPLNSPTPPQPNPIPSPCRQSCLT